MKKLLALLTAAVLVLGLTGCNGKIKRETLEELTGQAWMEGYQAGLSQGQEADDPPPPAEDQTDGTEQLPPERENFVSVAQAVPDVLVEARYYSTYNFVGERINGYEQPVVLVTREAAEALQQVSDDLAEQGFRLKLWDGYRPQRAVDHFKRWSADMEDQHMKPYFYPQVEKAELYERGYIASRSSHSRGSTVDLTLFDMAAGRDADMGGGFDWFDHRSHADYTGDLTAEQLANRKLLRDTMTAHGFRGISTEWWHFTLENEPYPDTCFDFPVREE